MMISYVIILNGKLQIVFKTKIFHTDERDLRMQCSEQLKSNRRFRSKMLRNVVLIMPDNEIPDMTDEEIKKKF
jgi:hypothetical protein